MGFTKKTIAALDHDDDGYKLPLGKNTELFTILGEGGGACMRLLKTKTKATRHEHEETQA